MLYNASVQREEKPRREEERTHILKSPIYVQVLYGLIHLIETLYSIYEISIYMPCSPIDLNCGMDTLNQTV